MRAQGQRARTGTGRRNRHREGQARKDRHREDRHRVTGLRDTDLDRFREIRSSETVVFKRFREI